MTKSKHYLLKNVMLLANILANLIAVTFFQMLMFRAEPNPPEYIWQNPMVEMIDIIFTPAAFIFIWVMTVRYERPIRHYLKTKYANESVSKDLEEKARRKVLNEPYVLICLDLSMWLLSAIVYASMWWIMDLGSYWVHRALFMNLSTGFITVILAFFLLEQVFQKRLAPYIFPEGKLSDIPKTLRIRIRTRLIALFFACNLIPLFSILHILHRITGTENDPLTQLSILRPAIFANASIFIIAGLCLTILVSRNLALPFGEIIQRLRQIRKGSFEKRVHVTTNDEIGYTGDVINEMTEGLKERERMQQSLNLAREVQQNLLPKRNLKVNGFDIAGKSIYCDETGGDYYDFISIGDADKQKIAVAIGDVAGHGISSALLMATVRSSLRFRASLPGSAASIMADVNRQLVQDVEDSGQFMTMFLLAFTTGSNQLEWVRAGHDPAIIYDPATDLFNELGGPGIALGVDSEWVYEDNKKTDLSKGQIIFLSTDGIWEARNNNGEMLGKQPILNAIRNNSSSDAGRIIDVIFDILDKFIGKAKIEDDITSVVIKMENC